MRSLCHFASVCLLAAIAAGCSSKVPVYPVSGKVVVGKSKKAAVGAMVFFNAVQETPGEFIRPAGTVDASGEYKITSRNTHDGAPEGEYIITLYWPHPQKSVFDCDDDDRLNGAYMNVEKSKFRFTVRPEGTNDVPAIELP